MNHCSNGIKSLCSHNSRFFFFFFYSWWAVAMNGKVVGFWWESLHCKVVSTHHFPVFFSLRAWTMNEEQYFVAILYFPCDAVFLLLLLLEQIHTERIKKNITSTIIAETFITFHSYDQIGSAHFGMFCLYVCLCVCATIFHNSEREKIISI